jgi:hypothetical protein
MQWQTQKISEDIKKLFSDKGINVDISIADPGGDYDTKKIIVRPLNENPSDDSVFISGFQPRKQMIDLQMAMNPPHDIGWVEICNRESDSDGGLSFDCAQIIRDCYNLVVNYFKAKGNVTVIRHWKQIF